MQSITPTSGALLRNEQSQDNLSLSSVHPLVPAPVHARPTGPVITRKRQLRAVTTLLLFVIQSINTIVSPLLLFIVAVLSHNQTPPPTTTYILNASVAGRS